MNRLKIPVLLAAVCLFTSLDGSSQQLKPAGAQSAEPEVSATHAASPASAQAIVPRLMKFTGVLRDATGKPVNGAVDVTFALYSSEAGGAPLWFETQSVLTDDQGRYTALLGAMHTEGLPVELFTSGEIRWLGIQVGLQPELPRVLLVSVPYALKAGDAETLGGKPASAFMLSDSNSGATSVSGTGADSSATTSSTSQSATTKTRSASASPLLPCSSLSSSGTAAANSIAMFTSPCNVEISNMYQVSGNVGIGTASPQALLDVENGNLRLGLTGTWPVIFNQSGGSVFTISNGPGKKLAFDYNGWLGLGTTAPAAMLHIQDGSLRIGRTGTHPVILDQSAGSVFTITNGAGKRLAFDANGNFGVGTTAPAAMLHIQDGSLRIGRTGTHPVILDQSAGSVFTITNGGNKQLAFDANGNFGVGTATPAAKLDVNGTANFSGPVTFSGGQTLSGNFNLPLTTGPGVGIVTVAGTPFLHTCCKVENTFLGVGAGNLATTGIYLTAVGATALNKNTAGWGNTALGTVALNSNTEGNANTALGYGALQYNTAGGNNLAAGAAALYYSSTGNDNTAAGPFSLYSNNAGSYNSANGAFALYYNTSGNSNTASGYQSLTGNQSGNGNSAFGNLALFSTTGSNNVGVGNAAGESNTTGSNNTFVGASANTNSSDANLVNATAIGANSTVNQSNSLVLGGTGSFAVKVGIGTAAPASLLTVTEASNADRGLQVTDGTVASNIFIQPLAGFHSGFQAINFNGYFNAGEVRVNTNKNRWRIFAEQRSTFDQFSIDTYNGTANTVVLLADTSGNITIPHNLTVNGTFSNPSPSSRRWKTNIQTLDGALEKVARLRGVSYDWKETGQHQIGVIAEEIAPVVPEVVAFGPNGADAVGVDYARLTALLIQATKEQQEQMKAQQAVIQKQQDQIAQLAAQLKAVEAALKGKY